MGLRAGHSKPRSALEIRGTQAWHPICTRDYYNISNWLKSTPFSTKSSTFSPLIHTTEPDHKAIEQTFSTLSPSAMVANRHVSMALPTSAKAAGTYHLLPGNRAFTVDEQAPRSVASVDLSAHSSGISQSADRASCLNIMQLLCLITDGSFRVRYGHFTGASRDEHQQKCRSDYLCSSAPRAAPCSGNRRTMQRSIDVDTRVSVDYTAAYRPIGKRDEHYVYLAIVP